MAVIDARGMGFEELGQRLRATEGDVVIDGCLGQRFIAAGMRERTVEIHGTPGNALGAYLDGAHVEVFGNAQDAVGDTMNAGTIVVRGNTGDTAGYAMRGGSIYVAGNAGYRAGIHMKQYQDRVPTLVIGGRAGSFLGEYQAGGLIIVLGLGNDGPIVGNFPCTGMHGGQLVLRSNCSGIRFPSQVTVRPASPEDMVSIARHVETFCSLFGYASDDVLDGPFSVVTPDSSNPYTQMYVAN